MKLFSRISPSGSALPRLGALFLPLMALLWLGFVGGCATHAEIRAKMVDEVRQGKLDSAMSRLQKIGTGEGKERVMDFMDRAMILHRQGQFEESNRYLEKAKSTVDRLYGVSVSDELGAIFWNDSARDFVGEEFEKVFILTLGAMNYAALGDMGAAAVEARQAQHKLTVYNDLLQRNKVKTKYQDDAFAWFFAGVCYEAIGERQDALFAYRKALRAYRDYQRQYGIPIPASLPQSILALAHGLGFAEVEEDIRKRFPDTALPEATEAQTATVYVFVGVGEVAHKISQKWLIPDPQGDVIGVTYPEFRRGNFNGAGAVVEVNGRKQRTIVTQDLSTLAIETLNEKNDQIKGVAVAKAMARYVAKKALRVASETSKNSGVQAFSLLADIALNVVDIVETADTRSWMTLPDHYQMARLNLPAGDHELTVRFLSRFGTVFDEQVFPVSLKDGDTQVIVAYGREAPALLPPPKRTKSRPKSQPEKPTDPQTQPPPPILIVPVPGGVSPAPDSADETKPSTEEPPAKKEDEGKDPYEDKEPEETKPQVERWKGSEQPEGKPPESAVVRPVDPSEKTPSAKNPRRGKDPNPAGLPKTKTKTDETAAKEKPSSRKSTSDKAEKGKGKGKKETSTPLKADKTEKAEKSKKAKEPGKATDRPDTKDKKQDTPKAPAKVEESKAEKKPKKSDKKKEKKGDKKKLKPSNAPTTEDSSPKKKKKTSDKETE